jgi:hypothetical protein
MNITDHPDGLLVRYLQALVEKSRNLEEEDIDTYCKYYDEVKALLENFAAHHSHRFIKKQIEEYPVIQPGKYRKPAGNYYTSAFKWLLWTYRINRLKEDTKMVSGISESIIERSASRDSKK